jgi:hypothetical protein
MVEAKGLVGRDGVLQALDSLTRLTTTAITDAFPFPQIFVFTNMIIVCSRTKIYEWVSSALVLKYTASTASGMWEAVDFYDYIYLTNGAEAVVRDAGTKVYTLSATLPHGTCVCNYNGQVLIGAPDIDGLAANMLMDAEPLTVTLSQLGSIAVT